MGKNKLFKFDQISKMNHVFEPSVDDTLNHKVDYKGKWHSEYFANDNPIVLELGCGKGEYAVGLARKYPNKNFVAVDIKGNRIYVGAKQAQDEGLTNIIFLRAKVDFIEYYFDNNEVDEIWLTFSDPQPNKPNKRLTSRSFIERYKKILKPNGIVHLKTDSDLLFESTENQIKKHGYESLFLTWDIYGDIEKLTADEQEILNIKTHYEQLFKQKGAQIKYCKFKIH
ncbi:tRNA (guanosine(46)-N7)-methyltransferase TrmB [Brumimicrobium salinarum]|uniref:tRNA (guanine-N(7)-)-methyltransferase n=1 Tax=Brumimicrobium salinarum TaxID=2058658 RepID=A0A2I0QZ29_9FLAO|nr:tRNA (guanosine(46)-N7)-methyltransferase TrmB [Brumimicrobium salinarum]PKR79591.1 tRNA (guanosine(46)-N7)-methyltransferase TrmB [Brumimicrobium salinarum]